MARVATPLPRLKPLGDQAVFLTCRNPEQAQRLGRAIAERNWDFVQDVVVAYHSLGVYLDRRKIDMKGAMGLLKRVRPGKSAVSMKLHRIPCCYELGLDLLEASEALNLEPERLIELHIGTEFTIYAIGFSPGFPYLGWLPRKLQGVSRRSEPRTQVPAGSVAIVGKQSAIYPQSTPGGWAIIGRTPLQLVDAAAGYFPLRVGDRVRFERIDAKAFAEKLGERISNEEDDSHTEKA
jgi:KipI family sensor histidine kinase inhibitor